jgi:hypothetical protein
VEFLVPYVLWGNPRFGLHKSDDGEVSASSPPWGHHLWRHIPVGQTNGWLQWLGTGLRVPSRVETKVER